MYKRPNLFTSYESESQILPTWTQKALMAFGRATTSVRRRATRTPASANDGPSAARVGSGSGTGAIRCESADDAPV